MKSYKRWSSLFWLLFSIAILIESIHLGIGALRNPGMGFMAFGASGLLVILSSIVFLQTFYEKEEAITTSLFSKAICKRVLLLLIPLLIYPWMMPLVGYLISTFLLMLFFFWILERKKVWLVLILSFLTTIITYYVFSVWLNCQFPSGPFTF